MRKGLVLIMLLILSMGCNEEVSRPEKEKSKNNTDEKQLPTLIENRYNVAFLIMEGTYNTELTAPYDIFQHTQYRKNIKQMNVFTVANTDLPVKTFEGLRILPDFNYLKDSIPKIDILVVPSAEHHLETDLEDEEMIKSMKFAAKHLKLFLEPACVAGIAALAGSLKGRFLNQKTLVILCGSNIDIDTWHNLIEKK